MPDSASPHSAAEDLVPILSEEEHSRASSPAVRLDDFFASLGSTNPFLANRVDRLLAGDSTDVPEIHGSQYRKFLALLHQALEQNRGLGAVLWGEAGVGKSHLLSRLRRWANDHQACFIYLHNLQASPERLPRYVLKCVISVLTGGPARRWHQTPLFRMINTALKEALDREGIVKPTWNTLERVYRHWLEELAAADPSGGILWNRTVYEVLLRFFRSAYPLGNSKNEAVAHLALRWLSGDSLDPAEAGQLGLRPERSGADLIALPDNQHIKQVLVALTQFARGRQQPFLLCFDQVDNLDEDQVKALSRFLHDLLDSAGNLLVITTGVRQTLLGFLQRGVITETSWQRLAQWEILLERIRKPEGQKILETRLRPFLTPFLELKEVQSRVKQDPLFPLGTGWFEQRLQGLPDFPPRRLLTWAGERWEALQEGLGATSGEQWLAQWPGVISGPAIPPPPLEVQMDQTVAQRMTGLKDQRLREPDTLPASADNLSGLLFGLLCQCLQGGPLAQVQRLQPPSNNKQPPYDFLVRRRHRAENREVRTGVRILATDSATTTAASLRWLLDDPQPPERVFLITDERQPLKLGKRGRDYLEELRHRPRPVFHHLKMSFDQYAELDALEAVVRLASSGDLEIDQPDGTTRRITEEEVIASHHRCRRYESAPLLRELLAEEVVPRSPAAYI